MRLMTHPVRNELVAVRLTAEELTLLRVLARIENDSVSSVIRRAVHQFAQQAARDPQPAKREDGEG